ncbi:MAG: HlyC/CorC family transporter [Rhodospirillales bacterium]|nr:HlyC/CorC family transporter [Alphaproteobacteria bacterium]USO03140.1 MAG: HlyC/CorC family transporter [Rhodospirillales bacterium]
MDFWLSVAIIFVLILLSGFFSGSETAMTAASRARLHAWSKKGNRRADLVNDIRKRKDRMIGALLLGNNLVNILASAMATSILIKLFGEAGVVYATLGMTILVLIFAEVLPKTYAIHHADKMAVFIAPVIRLVIWVFAPFVESVNWVVRLSLKVLGTDMSPPQGSDEDVLRGVIDLHEGEEDVQDQRAMLRSILDLADVEVEEITTHRKNVIMIDAENPAEKIIDDVLNSPFTRLPVYKGDTDNIIGVLHVKELLKELRAKSGLGENFEEHFDIEGLLTPPWFIPESTSLYDQLQAFRARCEHFAVVIDEYGTFMGIVTLEDILEEIVGEIDDEHDVAVSGVRKQSGGSFLVDGTVTIRDLNREFEWELPDQDYSTVAGLIIHESKSIPEKGQSFSFYGFRFDIVKRQRNQLTLIRVTPPRQSVDIT